MIARVAAACARRSGLVLGLALLGALACEWARRTLPGDAIPELADPRVAIVADWMGHPAGEVARAVTRVLTAALDGIPGQRAIRGSSMSGMAYVEVVFQTPAGLRDGRAEILRRVAAARPHLPATARVDVGPEASSTGWVLAYAIVSAADPMDFTTQPFAPLAPFGLRRFQDQVLRPALAAVPGVVEVASAGGAVEELLIEASPGGLRAAGVAFSDVVSSVRAAIAGGAAGPRDWPALLEGATGGAARARVVPGMASGLCDLGGAAMAVGGIVVARRGADVASVAAGVRAVLEREGRRLPEGATIRVVYDRAELAGRVRRTELRALIEELIAVVVVVLAFLLHTPSALVPVGTLPLVVLLTFGAMRLLGVAVDVMSLSGIGIALGLAVDADVVALEACHRALERAGPGSSREGRRALVVAAARALAPAILTSLVIAALTFLPALAFDGETGRLLRPLAITKTLVVGAAALVALTAAPALRDRLLARAPRAGRGSGAIVAELANPIMRRCLRAYRPFVGFALRRPAFTLVTAALAVVSCLPIAARLGAEFLPRLDEGDLLFMPTTAPGVDPEQAAEQLSRYDARLRDRPEVASVFGKVGRADTATDPAPFSMAEITVRLRPRDEWPPRPRSRWYSRLAPAPVKRLLELVWPEQTRPSAAEVMEDLDRAARLPGWTSAWTAPVRARMDMLSTGVRTPVGVRIFAASQERLDAVAAALRAALRALPGTRSAVSEAIGDETRLTFVVDPAAAARFHVDPALVRATADLVASGGQVGDVDAAGGRARVRLVPDHVATRPDEALRPEEPLLEATVRASAEGGGQPVPLALLGRVQHVREPAVVRVERGELVAYVHVDLEPGTDIRTYVERARPVVESAASGVLVPGERIEWAGQYQLWAAGQRRLMLIAPAVLLSMFLLLALQFRGLTEAAIVLSSVPFALVGSVWTLHLFGYRMSAPVWVGLLSVVGLAMQMGVVMVVYIDQAFHRRLREGRLASRDDIVAAHAEGTIRRLRPKLMTVATMAAGLAPLLWADGAGAEILRRVAAPMLGGIVSSAFLTLEVLPVLYTIWRHRQLVRARREGRPLADIVGPPPSWAR